MSGSGSGAQDQRLVGIAGALVGLFLLNKLRKRRKAKKAAKLLERARISLEEQRRKEELARRKARVKARMKAGEKEGGKDRKKRSIPQELARFTILLVMKKVISGQIEHMEIGGSKLGAKIAEAAKA